MFTEELFSSTNVYKTILILLAIVIGVAALFALLVLLVYSIRGKRLREEDSSNCLWSGPGVLAFGIIDPYSYYYIDSNYVSGEYGVFSKTTTKIMLNRVTATQVNRSLLGMIFDYGTIDFVTLGNDVPDLKMKVRHPNQVLEVLKPLQYQFNGGNRRNGNYGNRNQNYRRENNVRNNDRRGNRYGE